MTQYRDEGMDAEDFILSNLMTGKVYKGVEQAFGYVNEEGEYMLVAGSQSNR